MKATIKKLLSKAEKYIPLPVRKSPVLYIALKDACIMLLLMELTTTIAAAKNWLLVLTGCISFDVWLIIYQVQQYKRLRQQGIDMALNFAFSLYHEQRKTGLPLALRGVHDICDLDWVNSGTEDTPVINVAYQNSFIYDGDYPSESILNKSRIAIEKYRNAYIKRRPELQNKAYRSKYYLLELLDVSLSETAITIRILCTNTPEAVEYFETLHKESFQAKQQILFIPEALLDDNEEELD